MQYIEEGLDPTPLACISNADVLQMVRAAKPYITNKIGFIIWSQTAPDVVTNPEQANFLWGELDGSDVPTGNIYYYTGTSWQLWTLLDGSKLNNLSVTLAKLSVTGASALDIIQVNAGATALVFTSIPNAITTGSLVLSKLSNGGAGSFIFVSIDGINQFYTPTQLTALIPANTLSTTQLINAGVGNDYFLMSLNGVNLFTEANLLVNYIDDGTISLAMISSSGVGALQSIRRNALGNAWEAYTPDLNGFEPIYRTKEDVLSNYTAAQASFTTIDISALFPIYAPRYVILLLRAHAGEIVGQDNAQLNLRKDASSVTINAMSLGITSNGAATTITGTQILFMPITITKTFDYQIPTSQEFNLGLYISIIGYVL